MVVVETIFLVALAATDGYDSARTGEIARLVATYVDVVALCVLAHVIDSKKARAGLYAVFVALNFVRFETTGTFDYGFLHENVRELATPLGRRIATSQVRWLDILGFFVLPLVLGLFAMHRWPARSWSLSRSRRVLVAGACVFVLVLFPAVRLSTHESVTAFADSAVRFHVQELSADAALSGAPFPLVHDFVPSARAASLSEPGERRPHVIVLFLESWSGIYVDRLAPNGQAYTPVFDAHRKDGLAVDSFYASSIQSSRGRFATMCSLVPLARGKEFIDLADAPLHCLPHVLAEAGYHTMIDSASDEPEFEHSTEFFTHLGFENVRFEDPKRRANDPQVWGAGLQDDVYYRSLFTRMDDAVKESPETPLFMVAINASNHYPFDKNPAHVPDASGATKYARNYVASLRASDAWLTTFFEELDRRPAFRDALVALVGDHSFPADEHGVHFNALGAREETFRTAFSLRWPGRVANEVVKDRAASQLDLAPTVADLLQIHHTTTFMGRSLVGHDASDAALATPVPMVQPYDGVHLVAVQFPFKLVAHDSSMQEHLYDLRADPDETRDLLGDPKLAGETATLRGTIARIRESQAILHAKRVWPGTTTEQVSSEP